MCNGVIYVCKVVPYLMICAQKKRVHNVCVVQFIKKKNLKKYYSREISLILRTYDILTLFYK